jgi:hypothetical protein
VSWVPLKEAQKGGVIGEPLVPLKFLVIKKIHVKKKKLKK